MDVSGTSVSGDWKENTIPSTSTSMRTKLFKAKNTRKIYADCKGKYI